MPTTLRGAFLCAAAMSLVGSYVAVSRELLGYPVLLGQAQRYTLAAVILLAILARTRPERALRPRDMLLLGGLAAIGLAGFNVSVQAALSRADAAVVGTVIGITPLVLAVAGPLLARRRPAPRLVVAAGIVVLGVGLVYGVGRSSPVGLLWAAGALVGEVTFSLLAAPLLPRLGALRVSAYACVLAVPLLVGLSLATGERWRVPDGSESLSLLYLAVFVTAVAFLLWYAGLGRLGVERAGMFAGLVPVTTLVAASVLDGTWPRPLSVVGTVIVAAGLVAGLRLPGREPALTAGATGPPAEPS